MVEQLSHCIECKKDVVVEQMSSTLKYTCKKCALAWHKEQEEKENDI